MLESYKDILTVKEVSELLDVTPQLTRTLIRSGKLKAIRVGREYRIPKKNMIEFLEVQ